MSQYGYLWVKNENEGVIKGYTGEEEPLIGGKSPKEMMRILACDHSMYVQTNPESGETKSMMQNGTFNCQVDMDQSMPILYKAFIEGTKCEVEIYLMQIGKGETAAGAGSGGKYENYAVITLHKARIARVSLTKPPVYTKNDLGDLLDVSFSYGYFKLYHLDKKEAVWEFKKKSGQ
jgi:type VI secretion system Hcp family effector